MIPIVALWVPILLAAVIVFVVSSVIHTVLSYHRSDFRSMPAEADVMAALRPFAIPPGDYMVPRPATPADMKSAEYKARLDAGPVFMCTVYPNGPFAMGASLVQWFLYSIVVGVVVAYVTGDTLAPGTPYLEVFCPAAAVGFAGYSLALLQGSIWYRRDWVTTLKSVFDGLLYALLTAGVFAWRWPVAG
jgi:hypothetical protein